MLPEIGGGAGNKLFLRALRRNKPCRHLNLGFQDSRTIETINFCCSRLPVCAALLLPTPPESNTCSEKISSTLCLRNFQSLMFALTSILFCYLLEILLLTLSMKKEKKLQIITSEFTLNLSN